MSRFAWSLAVILALLVSAYGGTLVSEKMDHPNLVHAPATSAGLITIENVSFPPLTLTPFVLPTTTLATSTKAETPNVTAPKASSTPEAPAKTKPVKTNPVAPQKTPTLPQVTTQVETPITPPEVQIPDLPSSGEAALDATAAALRDALVNIVCYAPQGSGLHSISGSGIIVDSKGIILTNAHVAQYFLLKNRGVSCTVRSGSPAKDAYIARLMYISPVWIEKNSSVLTEASPEGTGENDFALLGIVGSASDTPLPTSFKAMTLSTSAPIATTPIVIASFGAQFLSTTQIQTSLFPTIVFGSVKQVFTFDTNTIDVVDLGGSVAAQEGSSGGGIATAQGTLAGTITTSTIEGSTDTRSLSAITATYIEREYESETGSTLTALFSKTLSTAISDFVPKIPDLEAKITAQLAQ